MKDYLDLYFDRSQDEMWSLARLHYSVLSQIQNSPLWQKEEIPDIPLTEEQMITLVHGHHQNNEVRYGLCFLGGYFYVTRSGFWLKKIKFAKKEDGFYHVAENYSTERGRDQNLFKGIIIEGDFFPRVYDDRLQQLFEQQDKDERERNLR